VWSGISGSQFAPFNWAQNAKPALDVKQAPPDGDVRVFASVEAMCHNVHMKTISIPGTAPEDRAVGSPRCSFAVHRGHRSRSTRRGASAI